MPRRVSASTGEKGVVLPGGWVLNAGDEVVVSDNEWAEIDDDLELSPRVEDMGSTTDSPTPVPTFRDIQRVVSGGPGGGGSFGGDASEIVSGTMAIARLPVADDGESSTTEVVRANDARLSNARTPTTHAHAQSDVTGLVGALNGKEPQITSGLPSQYWAGDKTWKVLDKAAVGLPNVPNTDATNADNIASGHVPLARLGTGTPAAGKYVDGAAGAWTDLPAAGGGASTLDDLTDVNIDVVPVLGHVLRHNGTEWKSVAGATFFITRGAVTSYMDDLLDDPDAATARTTLGLGNVVNLDTTNASNITSGTLPTSVLPPLAISDTFPVASQAAMLALTAQRGDVAVRTDLTPARVFILTAEPATTLGNWTEITAAGSVVMVNGQTGTVVLTKADMGLDQVPNVDSQNASNLNSGQVPLARLGTGTPAAGKYVDGASGAWTTLPAGGGGAASLDGLTDVAITTGPGAGRILRGDGTNFVDVLGTDHFQAADPELAALAAAGSAANKVPYYDGSASATLADLTAYARTLLAAADAAAVRGLTGAASLGTVESFTAQKTHTVPIRLTDQGSTVYPNPAAGFGLAYYRSDGYLYVLDSAGVERRQGPMTGSIAMWPLATTPAGFLSCVGGTQLISAYPALAMVLGTTYGGNGTTTFGIPDFRDLFPIGASATKTVPGSGGSATVTIGSTNLPPHTHGAGSLATASDGNHSHAIARRTAVGSGGGTAFGAGTILADLATSNDGAHTHNVTGSTAGTYNNDPLSVVPPWRAANFIIRT